MASSSKKLRLSYDLYELLGLQRGCAENEIDKAYKKKALKWHPDKNPDIKEKAQAMFIKIYEAYEFLKDSTNRKEYDEIEIEKQRKAEYDQARRATSSANRKEFMDRLHAKEREAEEERLQAKKKVSQKRKSRDERRVNEERRRARDSSIERLGREASEMLKQKLQEEEEKRRKEEKSSSGMNFNMTAEEFAKFEQEVLGS